MLIHLHPQNPQARQLKIITECLKDGGIIIYPTDTIYGLGCDIYQPKSIQKICRIKGIDVKKAQLSFICADLSSLSDFTKGISTPLFRLLKAYLPGPYTFILPASKQVPQILKSKKDTIGLRVPDNIIAQSIVQMLERPILSSSLSEEMVRIYTDATLIHEKFKHLVDIVVDGGVGGITPSTIIDYTTNEGILVRSGLGKWPKM